MKCHICGSIMESVTTTLPFKVSQTTIIIVKNLPVLQCQHCREYLLADSVMAVVENILHDVDEPNQPNLWLEFLDHIDSYAIDTGIADFSINHEYYLYGGTKRA